MRARLQLNQDEMHFLGGAQVGLHTAHARVLRKSWWEPRLWSRVELQIKGWKGREVGTSPLSAVRGSCPSWKRSALCRVLFRLPWACGPCHNLLRRSGSEPRPFHPPGEQAGASADTGMTAAPVSWSGSQDCRVWLQPRHHPTTTGCRNVVCHAPCLWSVAGTKGLAGPASAKRPARGRGSWLLHLGGCSG